MTKTSFWLSGLGGYSGWNVCVMLRTIAKHRINPFHFYPYHIFIIRLCQILSNQTFDIPLSGFVDGKGNVVKGRGFQSNVIANPPPPILLLFFFFSARVCKRVLVLFFSSVEGVDFQLFLFWSKGFFCEYTTTV